MSNQTGQVKIGREFFAKVPNDYADWRWALVREFLQNCMDAPGCDRIWVGVAHSEGKTSLVVRNNGRPMDRDTLVNKLLTLGGSGKNFEGDSTGGFGVAKSLLYYTHLGYRIKTGSLVVEGEGAQYSLEEVGGGEGGEDYLDGTESTVTMEGDQAEILLQSLKRFAGFAQWKGEIRLNGEVWAADLKKGSRRRDLTDSAGRVWATVYTNRTYSNVCVVRLNGQPMFTRYCRFPGCVVVELSGQAKDTLTSNRDSLKYELASDLNDLLTALAVDKRSALREQKAAYKRFLGEKLRAEAARPKAGAQRLTDLVDVSGVLREVMGETGGGLSTETVPETAGRGGSGAGVRVVTVDREDIRSSPSISLGHEFIIKNTTGMITPDYYSPGENFSKYSRDLVRVWVTVLVKLYQIHGLSGEFSVGFVFDEESEAEFERSSVYGNVYYLNPARVVCQRDKPQCRSFKARFSGAWSDRFAILALAAHEFVHGALNYDSHDEGYAGALTEVMAKVMEHLKDLTPLFRS